MISPDPALCNSCGAPVDAHSKSEEHCSRCCDLMQVRDAFDSRLPEILDHGLRGGDLGQALALLDGLDHTFGDRDHDGWLGRSIRTTRAMILAHRGRHDDALRELRTVESLVAFGTDDYVLTKESIARTLERSGRPVEALAELTPVVESWEQLPEWTVLGLLSVYTDIASAANQNVDERCQQVLGRWAERMGIPLSPGIVATDVRSAIRAASAQRRDGERRFSVFYEKFQRAPEKLRDSMTDEYIAAEPLGYIKARAMALLTAV